MSQHGMSTPQGCSDLSQLSLEELHRRKQALEAEVAKHQEAVNRMAQSLNLCEWYSRMSKRKFAKMEPLAEEHGKVLQAIDWKEDRWKDFFAREEPKARVWHSQSVETLENSEAKLERVQRELQVRKAREFLQLQGE